MKTLDLDSAKSKAYRLLAMRPHSEHELKVKLRDKGFSEAIIDETVEKLQSLKYLSDASFALQWARNLALNKLWGNRKISQSLKEKGVAARLIEEAIGAVRQEFPEEEAIAMYIRKKTAKKMPAALEIKEKQRIFTSLRGRGFPPGLILNYLGKRAEDDIDDDDR